MKKLTCCDSCGGSLKMLDSNYIKCNYCGQIYASVKDGEWSILNADEVYQKAMELQQLNTMESCYVAADMFESLGAYNDSNIKAVACLDNVERLEAEEAKKLEEQRKAEEARLLEEQRKAEEAKRLEEQRRAEEEQRKAEEAKRLEEQRRAEEERRLEEQRRAEEARRLEAQRKAEEDKRLAAARLAEEAEMLQRMEEERAERRQKMQKVKKNIGRIVLVAAAIVLCVVIVNTVVQSRKKAQEDKYVTAVAKLEDNSYDEALTLFKELGSYKDAADYVSDIEELAADYQAAEAKYEAAEYGDALEKFKALGDYRKSADYVSEIEQIMADSQTAYEEATALYEAKEYSKALEQFASIEFYMDSADYIDKIGEEVLSEANSAFAAKDYEEAAKLIALIPESCASYQDAAALIEKIEAEKQAISDAEAMLANYNQAIELYNSGDYTNARVLFLELNGYEDSANYLNLIAEDIYEQAEELYDDGELLACVEAARNIDESTEWEQYQQAVTLIDNAKTAYATQVNDDAIIVLRAEGYSAFEEFVVAAVCDLYSEEEARSLCNQYKPVSLATLTATDDSGYVNVGAFYKYQNNWDDEYKYTDSLGKTYEYGMNRMDQSFSTADNDSYIEYDVTRYNFLTGTVILNEYCESSEKAGTLVIYGDGEEIYTSPDVLSGFEPLYISVDISEYNVIRFEFDGNYSNVSLVEPCLSE